MNRFTLIRIFILILVAIAAPADAQPEIDFENQILPILTNRCIECHSAPKADASGRIRKPKGGVQLDSVEGITESRRGEVIIAGDPDSSLLYERITLPEDDIDIMPPPEEGTPLTKKETDLIRKWIEQGANYGRWKGNQLQGKLLTSDSKTHQPAVMPLITSLAFAPDGESVVVCSQAGLHVYDWPKLNLQKAIKTTALNLHHLAFSPSGDRLAVVVENSATEGFVEIFSWPEGKSLRILRKHDDSVMAVAWRDASSLASASLDRSIILWDLQTGASI